MGLKFNAAEVIDLGVQIEINGKAFYAGAASRAKSPDAKELFVHLGKEEEHHIAAFRKLLDIAEKTPEPESYDGEYSDYIQMLAGDNIFTKEGAGQRAAEKLKTDTEIIHAALKFEKDSVILFQGMMEGMPERERKIVDALVQEEMKHIKHLYALKKVCRI